MRRIHRVDANQSEIVTALTQAGYSVLDLSGVGGGAGDILVGGVDRADGVCKLWLLEIKTASGHLNALQQEFHAAWRGPIHVVRSVDEALRIVGVG